LFGKIVRIPALRDVSISLEKGDTLGLVGESGSGKSTAARLMLGLIPASSGTIYYQGEELDGILADSAAERRFRKSVQMVFQDPASTLNPRINIYHILKEILAVHGIAGKKEYRDTIGALLDSVELERDAMYRYAHEFSGGQRQRIGIARALATKPDIVVLDEPVSALDISVQSQILNLLIELKRTFGLTYLFISHDLGVVRYLCNKVVVLYLGKVMEAGTKDDIFKRSKHPYTELLLASSFSLSGERKEVDIHDDIMLDDRFGEGCPFYGRCPKRQDVCLNPVPRVELGGEHYAYCTQIGK
jgi:peptide/nickel transport system ATP-binding protein